MLAPDVQAASEPHPVVLVAKPVAHPTKALSVGVCFPVQNFQGVPLGLDSDIAPAGTALNALFAFQKKFPRKAKDAYRNWIGAAKVEEIVAPKYGRITRTVPAFSAPDSDSYYYNLKMGDMRKDRSVYLVEVGGYQVKLIYTFYPTENGGGAETEKQYCGKRGTLYRVVEEVQR